MRNGQLGFSSNFNNRLWAQEAMSIGGSHDLVRGLDAVPRLEDCRPGHEASDFTNGLFAAARMFERMAEESKNACTEEHRQDVKARGLHAIPRAQTTGQPLPEVQPAVAPQHVQQGVADTIRRGNVFHVSLRPGASVRPSSLGVHVSVSLQSP